MDFNEANKIEHPVEGEWHYPILTKYGFEPITKMGIGFVRSYLYENKDGLKIRCATGSSADYWNNGEGGDQGGYWASLEPYLKSIT